MGIHCLYVKTTVKIGANAIVNLTMPLAGASEEIVVEETRNVIDTESGNQGSVLTKEFLERIPAGRSKGPEPA